MKVIPPLTADVLAVNSAAYAIEAPMLTSTTAAEPGVGEVAWASGSTYAQGDRAILGAVASTVTVSVASPGVVTWSSNGLPDGTPVILTTTGALPTGLTAGKVYYVLNRASGTFQLAEAPGGSAIVTTGTQSGTHTATAHLHRIYESQAGSNTGNPPAIDDGTKWLDVGPTNRWAMFDLLRNTGTTAASPLTVEITPGQRIDGVGLVGLVADEATVTVTVDGSDLYTSTVSLLNRPTAGWYDYFFGTFIYRTTVAYLDLPPYNSGVITVTLTRASGMVTCGGVVLGRQADLGDTEEQAADDTLNFSTIDRDSSGGSILIQRRSVPKTTQRTLCAKSAVPKARMVRDLLNAVPALWVGLDDSTDDYFESVMILGVYKRFTINLEYPDYAIIDLDLEEV
jgi:hypothetical protein